MRRALTLLGLLTLVACSRPPAHSGPIACSASQPCPAGLLCGYAPGCGEQRGVCQDRTCGALPVMRPYCGCDGQTFYGGACRPGAPYHASTACEVPTPPRDAPPRAVSASTP